MIADSSSNPSPSGHTLFDRKQTVRVDDPGDVIAAIPHLIGYFPHDALATTFVRDGVVIKALCCNSISDVAVDPASTGELLDTLAGHAEGEAILTLVAIRDQHHDDGPPHAALIDAIARRCAELGVDVAAFWTTGIAKGARWSNYHDLSRTCTVADPACSPAAAATAMQGRRTFASRAELVATLEPAPQEVLHRREMLLLGLAAAGRPAASDAYRLVADHVTRAGLRTGVLTDTEVAQLAYALGDLEVRDACLGFAATDQAAAAERLWTELTRQSPVPERAQPAVLLAVSAYLRGDGALSSVALDRAQAASPGHRLARLIRQALDTGLPSERLRSLAEQALATGREWSQGAHT